MRGVLRRLRGRSPAADQAAGFTLVETVVALFVITLVIASILPVFLNSVKTIADGRQQQDATGLADQALEQIRALPYATVVQGLSADCDSTLVGDPNITGTGASATFTPTFDTTVNEPLATHTDIPSGSSTCPTVTAPTPLQRHRSTVVADGVTYTVRSYVSKPVPATGAPQQYALTVAASWPDPLLAGHTRSVVEHSREFSPAHSCLNGPHPFSGPCQSIFYGLAGTTPGSVVITPTDPTQPAISGLPAFTSASLTLPVSSSTVSIEQVVNTDSALTTSLAKLIAADGTTTTTQGGTSAAAHADTDPATTGGSPTASATQSGSALAVTGSGALALSLLPFGGDSGTGAAAAAADGTTCVDTGGTPLATQQPCAGGSLAQTAGNAGVTLDLGSISSRDVGLFTLAAIAPTTATDRFVTGRYIAGTTTVCPTAYGDGCVGAAASAAHGNASIGGLPAATMPGDVVPAGFASLLSVSGWHATATADSGLGHSTPAVTEAGTLSYWNGTGYTAINLGGQSAGQVDPSPVTATYKLTDGTSLSVVETATIAYGGYTAPAAGGSSCAVAACTVTEQVNSPAVATVTYAISHNGSTLAQFTMVVDLGGLLTKATYKSAGS